jgi:SDR family mycofactocin-dependent oxidoreductase
MTSVALVTGAARGIGAATAALLAEAGWSLVLIDRCEDDPRLPYALGSKAELAEVVERAQALGAPGCAVLQVADASDAEAMGGAVALAEERFGGLDAFVAAAGVVAGGVPAWEMPTQQVDALLVADLRSVVACAQAGVPALLQRPEPRRGRFIAVASAAATRGMPNLAVYCAAKAGVVGFVRALAAELHGTGVTANAVSPGSTRTAALAESARLYGLDSPEDFATQQSLERLIDPAEVAAMIAWLAGEASSAVTGANLAVDGGLSI